MQNHPHLNRLYKIYLSENEPFRKVHRLIDCFECFIKMYTAILLSEYYHKKDISNEIRQLLYEGLRFPSLGTWQRFSDKLLEELKNKEHVFLIDDFENGFYNLNKFVDRNAKLNIINFRNIYAHGATPNNEYCNKDIEAYSPILEKLTQEKWLSESLTFINSIGNVCIKNKKGQSLSLFPILVIEKNDIADKIVFFNDLDYYNGDVGLLNYITAHRYREKELFKHFSKRYKLAKWQDPSLMKERQKNWRIDDLTLNFTGRENEKQFIYNFIDINDKGFLTVTGNPGMGKSTLLAEIYKHYERRNSGNIHPILYFIQRGLGNDSYSLLKYLHDKIDETKIVSNNRRGNSSENMFLTLQEKLSEWPIRSRGKKLLIIIDGLDEGIEPPNNFITDYLVNQTIPQVLFIYSSRPGGHDKIIDFLDNLPRENTSRLSLVGLTKENIRALLYEVTDKYKLEQNWVDIILKKSQGSALYLKLLCKEIQNERIIINNGHELPNHINDCYDRIFKKYRQFPERDILLNCIFIYAVAKDSLTKHHLELILGIGPGTSLSILSIIKEVLSVDENNQNAYFLFHESLRDYILNEFSSNILDAHKQIVEFGNKWEEYKGKKEQQYALKFQYHHLLVLGEKNKWYKQQLIKLAQNNDFHEAQKSELNLYDYTQYLLSAALRISCSEENIDMSIGFAIALISLRKEEENNFEEILGLLKSDKINQALSRVENINFNNKDNIKAQFIIYMNCLQQFTLGILKEHKKQKEICEELLNHLDKSLTKEHSVLNWDEFYPSKLVYLIARELSILNLDDGIIWKRTISWDSRFIKGLDDIDEIGFEVLINALFLVEWEEKDYKEYRCKPLTAKELSIKLYSKGKIKEAINVLNRALNLINSRSDISFVINSYDRWGWFRIGKSTFLQKIAEGFIEINQKNRAIEILQKACSEYQCEREIYGLIKCLINCGLIEEAINFSAKIKDEKYKIIAYMSLAKCFLEKGNIQESEKQIANAYSVSNMIKKSSSEYEWEWWLKKDSALFTISEFLAEMGKFDDSIKNAEIIHDENDKEKVYIHIAYMYANLNLLKDAMDTIMKIKYPYTKDRGLHEIANCLIRNKDYENAILVLDKITDELVKEISLNSRVVCYSHLNKLENVLIIFNSARDLDDNANIIRNSASIFIEQNELEKANKILDYYSSYILNINSKIYFTKTSDSVFKYIDKLGDHNFSLKALFWILCMINNITDKYLLSHYYSNISKCFTKIKEIEWAFLVIKYTSFYFEQDLFEAAEKIVDELVLKNENDRALAIADRISDSYFKQKLLDKIIITKSYALRKIAQKLILNNSIASLREFIHEEARFIDSHYQNELMRNIVEELLKSNRIDDSLAILIKSNTEDLGIYERIFILELLIEKGESELAEKLIQECIYFIKLYGGVRIHISHAFHIINVLAALQNEIKNYYYLNELKEISLGLQEKVNFEYKDDCLIDISKFYFSINEIHNALKSLSKINNDKITNDIINDFSENYYLNYGITESLKTINEISNEKFKKQWFLNLISVIMPNEVANQNLLKLLFFSSESSVLLENILMHYSVAQCFFTNKPNLNALNKISKVLDIQKIIANIPEQDSSPTDNIEKWLLKYQSKFKNIT